MKKLLKKSLPLVLLIVATGQLVWAQSLQYKNSHYIYHEATTALSNGTVTGASVSGLVAPGAPIGMPYSAAIDLPASLSIPTRKINKALFSIKANLGNDYAYGIENANLFFDFKISFQLDVLDNSGVVISTPIVFDNLGYDLRIENKKPEAAWVKDFTAFASIGNPAMNADFAFKKIRISNVVLIPQLVANPSNTNYVALLAQIANSIRFELDYDIEYGLDVTSVATKPLISSLSYPTLTQKRQLFTWSNGGYEHPNYEFQLLRLYNTDPSKIVNERDIVTTIDWSKALRIETQSSATSLQLTIAEGTGYYIWRVRPIGTYYSGGIANHLNYSNGSWSEDLLSLTNINLTSTLSTLTIGGYSGALSNPYFYYLDPDDEINWIYSRKFTEENKVSESITYATPGQHIRQVQAFLPSKDTTLVTQSIIDKTGRPSLSTLPVPTAGSIQKYKPRFVTKEGTSTLYQDVDFDTDANYRDPAKVNQSPTTDYKYYSENNPDKAIPDAQGYPYQRTLYYNDGSGRVMEQSGVGKTHMIGDGITGGDGKTVKTLYGTASETELIRLFGDEAPDHEGVMKTITIDQNGTASVTYTSKEGKVIATALSYQLIDNLDTFDPLNGETGLAGAKVTVDDKITRNIKTDYGFLSTKRIALTNTTDIDIDYKVNCQILRENCFDLNLDCKYRLQVIIHHVESNTGVTVYDDLINGRCDQLIHIGTFNRLPGTYVIEKKLIVGDPQILVENAEEKANKQIMPLLALVTGKLKDVDCEKELEDFYCWLEQLTYDIYSSNPSFPGAAALLPTCGSSVFTPLTDPRAVEVRYGLPTGLDPFLTNNHFLTIIRANNKPVKLRIQSPCCDMSVSVSWVPPFRCPTSFNAPVDINNNGKLEANIDFITNPAANEFSVDFEGYMMSILKDCIVGQSPLLQTTLVSNPSAFVSTFKDVFYGRTSYDVLISKDDNGDDVSSPVFFDFMAGWGQEGDFNWMVQHMLTDEYDCRNQFEVRNSVGGNNGNPVALDTKDFELDDCGNPLSAASTISCGADGKCTQYKCSALANCITALAAKMTSLFCENSFDIENPMRPSDKVDEQSTSDPKEKTHDDNFDEGFEEADLSKRKKKKIAKKVSEMMRELQTIQSQPFIYEGHLVSEFLGCTGYKFAKILTPADPTPLDNSNPLLSDVNPALSGPSAIVPNYKVPYTAIYSPSLGDPKKYSPRGDWENIIVHRSVNSSGVLVPDKTIKELFPKIKDPRFAFKYFEYEEDHRDIELLTCYSDPNDCKDGAGNKVPCCWNSAQSPFPSSPSASSFCVESSIANSTPNHTDNKKYIVKNFCGRGQVECPYTHEDWSCGQRNTYYQMIKNLRTPPPGFVEAPTFTTETCALYELPNSSKVVAEDKIPWTSAEASAWASYKKPADNADLEQVPITTFEMRRMEFRCNNKCAERRAEFKDSLMKILQLRCYQIGGCKVSANDNIILEKDIEDLVDAVVAKCSLQCPITTYNCLGPVECRDADTPINALGATRSDIEIMYGVNGTNDCERKKWKQVMHWSFEVDIPSKCSTNTGYTDFTCAPNPDLCSTPSTEVGGTLGSSVVPFDPSNTTPVVPKATPGIGVTVTYDAQGVKTVE